MTADECREKVEAAMDNGAISKWESSFLVSMTDKLDRGQILSGPEQDRIEEIHEKIFGGRSRRWRQ